MSSSGQINLVYKNPSTGDVELNTGSKGAINTFSGMALPQYDYVAQTQNTTQDVWTFYSGGSGGTLVATVTITYTDATKATIANVALT